jgi:hypothetical protein
MLREIQNYLKSEKVLYTKHARDEMEKAECVNENETQVKRI